MRFVRAVKCMTVSVVSEADWFLLNAPTALYVNTASLVPD